MNPSHEAQWANWMRAAVLGDSDAYRLLLQAITPYIRAAARRRAAGLGPQNSAEEHVQEVLFARHPKRMSGDTNRPIGPWISTILRYKLIDAMRRRSRQIDSVPIDHDIDVPEACEP